MFERGIIKRLPSFKAKVRVDPAIKGKARRIAIGEAKEAESRRRLTMREKYIAEARGRAYAIARSIGRKGMRGRFPVGKSLADIKRFIRSELNRVRRGDHR